MIVLINNIIDFIIIYSSNNFRSISIVHKLDLFSKTTKYNFESFQIFLSWTEIKKVIYIYIYIYILYITDNGAVKCNTVHIKAFMSAC